MHPRVSPAVPVVLAVVLCMTCLAGGAWANVSVSTTDGVTLTLTDAGAFSSLTVDGNTVPTLAGVSGGFFIVPMDGQAMDYSRQTYYAGTQVTGTATQSGSDIHLTTAVVQNQTFDIWLRGGLPYIKIEATITGNGSDHVFLMDFRLPVDANGWKWGNNQMTSQTISTGSASNWYFNPAVTYQGYHPYQSNTPYSNISAYNVGGVPNMGLSLAPVLIPPESYAMEYNKQTGYFIESELGTTSKTTLHPNTATFKCVLYKHNPQWGFRSAVQRYQSIFPEYYLRRTAGGNWFLCPGTTLTNMPNDPISDFAFKFGEGQWWTDSYWSANNVYTCSYIEPWGLHTKYIDTATAYANAADLPDNWTCAYTHDGCPTNTSKGCNVIEYAQAILNNYMQNTDGSIMGPDNPRWADEGFYLWPLNPDPDKGDTMHLTPGITRASLAEFREQYWQWTGAPHRDQPTAGQTFSGLYWDSVCAFGTAFGWDNLHNFRAEDWATYPYNPGIYWGQWGNNPGGTLCMWDPFLNLKIMDYTYQQMRRENRIVFVNSGGYPGALTLPYWDAFGQEAHMDLSTSGCCWSLAHNLLYNMALNRAIAGPKPVSFMCTGSTLHTAAEMNLALVFNDYPGMGDPNEKTKATYEANRTLYQQYTPIFNTLDAAIWHPVTGATAADSAELLERYGPDSSGAIYLVLWTQNASTGTVTCSNADLGWQSNPNVTVTSLLGATPSTSYNSGQLVLSYGSLAAGETRVTKIVYNGTVVTPRASFSGTPTSGNASLAVTFTDASVGSPTGWFWNFGDGSTSTVQSPSHTFTSGGTFSVALTAKNANGEDPMTKVDYISVAATPAAAFSSYCVYGPPPLNSEFHDRSTNVPTSWSWNFGDGNTSTAQNPTHSYTTPGNYTVTLTATNARGSSSPCAKTNLVTVKAISALFSGNPIVGGPGMVVQFTDLSSGTPTAWSWDFGDSGTSTAQNPSHTYNTGGYYTVALTVTNAGGNDTCTLINYITVGSAVVYVYPTYYEWGNPGQTLVSGGLSNLQAQDQSYMVGSADTTGPHSCYTARYTANAGYSSSQILTLEFDYVGHCSTLTNYPGVLLWARRVAPGQGYPFNFGLAQGTWSATDQSWSPVVGHSSMATVVDDANNNTIGLGVCTCNTSGDANNNVPYNISSDLVRWKITLMPGLSPQPPVANFTGNPTSGPAPLAVSFTDLSTNAPTSWSWSFGDSSTSTMQNPSHTYNSTGNYTVALTATNAQGNNTNTKNNYISVTSGSAPVADFSGTPTSGNAPLSVTFTDSSTNTPTSWSWTFGDSSTSTVQNPGHTYNAAGNYTVALTATNQYGNNTCTKNNYITVSSGSQVEYHLAWQSPSVPPTSGSITDTYTEDGSYEVFDALVGNPTYYGFSLYGPFVTTYAPSQISKIRIEWKAKSSLNGKPNAWLVIYDANANQYPTSSQALTTSNATLAWETTDPATFVRGDGSVYCRLCTCSDVTYTVSIDLAHMILTLYSAPVADFSGTPTSGTAPLAVTFTDSSTNSPTAWSWTFGDGNSSTAQNPSHTYSSAGLHTVALTATNAYGNNTNTKTDYIAVNNPAPVADFSGTPTSGPYPLAVAFTDTSTNTPTSWSWTFGDSSTSTVQNPSHTYSSPGSYTVSLTATNPYGSDGETKTDYITVTTTAYAYLDYQDYTGWQACTLISGTLADTQTDNDVYRVIQSTPTGGYCTWDEFLTTYQASQVVKIHVDYKAKSSVVDTPRFFLLAYDYENAYHATGAQTVLGTDESTLSWETTDVPLYLLSNGRIRFRECGCPQFSAQYQISVDLAKITLTLADGGSPVPTAAFSGAPTSGYLPLAVSFTDSSTGSPTAWGWNFGDYLTSTAQNPSHTYTSAGTYTVTLTATNAHGWDSETKTNYITASALPPAPVANFSGTPTSGTAPLAVAFTDTSTNTPTAWSWDFGDSSTSTVQNPSHTYAAGTYTVSLTATNAGGSDGETKTNYITATVAAPTFVAAGSVASGTGAITPALPAGLQANDILLLFLETANQAISISNQNGGTWAQVTNSPQGYGTAGASNATRLTVSWSRYNGTQGAPTTSDSGNHQLGRIIAIRGATTSGNPWDVTAGGTESTADTSGAIPGATTTVANTLVVAAIATSLPDTSGTTNFSAWANADLTGITERTDNTRSAGNGGGLGVATGVKATAGAYTTTSVTCGTASTKAMMSIAIKP